jgi:mersacidin/lichenicidin family type 2 lantibiotic
VTVEMNLYLMRVWKGKTFPQCHSEEQYPAHPADPLELSDSQLANVCGGQSQGEGDLLEKLLEPTFGLPILGPVLNDLV